MKKMLVVMKIFNLCSLQLKLSPRCREKRQDEILMVFVFSVSFADRSLKEEIDGEGCLIYISIKSLQEVKW